MPYRDPSSTTDAERVELLRFVPRSKRWMAWGALALALALIVCVAWLSSGSTAPWMTVCVGLFGLSLSALSSALKSASPVVATLEHDRRGRVFCVRRRILGVEFTRRWRTEELPVLIVQETRANHGDARLLSISAIVMVDRETSVALFDTANDEDARAFRAESWHFTRRALKMPGRAYLRAVAVRAERELDEAASDELAEIIERDDANALRTRIEQGLAVDARVEFESMTLVDFAATRGAARCVRALLELGAEVSPHTLSLAGYCAPPPDGDERERYLRHVEVVRVLLDAGVDAEADNCEGVPARMALEDAGPEMAEFVAYGKREG
ncbi:MAG: hypothetical protein JNK05_37830 [Myxococcales bacterium]|nr:hypothetical protein [Myxococcales bacterium]